LALAQSLARNTKGLADRQSCAMACPKAAGLAGSSCHRDRTISFLSSLPAGRAALQCARFLLSAASKPAGRPASRCGRHDKFACNALTPSAALAGQMSSRSSRCDLALGRQMNAMMRTLVSGRQFGQRDSFSWSPMASQWASCIFAPRLAARQGKARQKASRAEPSEWVANGLSIMRLTRRHRRQQQQRRRQQAGSVSRKAVVCSNDRLMAELLAKIKPNLQPW